MTCPSPIHRQVGIIRQQRIRDDSLQKHTSQQSAVIGDLQNKYNQLASTVNKTRHVESGIITCGNSVMWTSRDVHGCLYQGIHENFSNAYVTPPTVHLSIQHIGTSDTKDTDFFIDLMAVTERGFDMRCGTWRSDGGLYDFNVRWISM